MTRWAFAVALASLFGFVATRTAVNDPDTFWHLASGRWMVEHGALLTRDPFSHTAAGQPYALGQWLGDLALWSAYSVGSWWGIVALRGLIVTAIAAVVFHRSLALAPRPWVGALAALPGLALSRIVWADRPELLGLLCFVAFISLALAAREGNRPAAWALPPLFALWANVHGSFVVGVVLIVALAVESAIFARDQRRVLASVAALAIVATFLNPDGPGVYDSPGWHFTNPPRFIQEWLPPDVTTLHGALFGVTLFGSLALALLGSGGATAWVAILVPLAALGLSAQRHMPLFALAAAPYIAATLPEAFARFGLRLRTTQSAPALPGAVLTAVLLGAGLVTSPREPDLSAFPTATLPQLRASDGALLNEYDWGGFLIWYAPDRPVFIDGRLRPYTGAVLDDYVGAMSLRRDWREILDRHRVEVVLVRKRRPLAVRLREAGWQQLASDEDAVLLRRP